MVGHLNKAHGTKGELFAWPLTDHPDSIYVPENVLQPGNLEGTEPDPDLAPLRVVSARPFKRGYLVSFAGVTDRNAAERLQGRYLFAEADAVEPLAEGEVFYHQLLGMEVVTVDGESIGTIREVYELRPAHLLEVLGPRGEVMIPFVRDIVLEVDAAAGRMVVDPPAGLLDL
ncbi:MAG: ribosome maturation factor RimM [Gemmatimonadota bacterium]